MADWKKVEPARRWRPAIGAMLEGAFRGRAWRDGKHGLYQIALVEDDSGVTWRASGAVIDTLFDSAGIAIGARVRLLFLGERVSKTSGHAYADFDLYVLSGD